MLRSYVSQRSRPRSAGLGRDKHKGGTVVIAVLVLLLLWSLYTNIQVCQSRLHHQVVASKLVQLQVCIAGVAGHRGT